MPRKDIDLSDQHIAHLDAMRADRRVSYSDIVKASLDAYFAPQQPSVPANLNERLWSLDSSTQKTAERLATLEAIAQQSMELLMLIAERMTEDTAETIDPTPEPVIPAHIPAHSTHDRITDVTGDPRSRWYIPPEPPPEKRSWFRRSQS